MGVMNKMRDNMAGIMIFLVVVFVLTMSVGGLVGGADVMDLLSGNQPNAFTVVNGEELSRESFMRSLQNERENFRQRNGAEPTEDQMAQISDQVWETMVTQILISQAVKDQDISVSPEEIRYFFTENVHPSVRQYFTGEDGVFDFNAYQDAISSPQAANFFAAMHQQVAAVVPIEKLQQKIIATAQVSEAEVRSEYIGKNISYDLDYLLIKSALWKNEEVEISDQMIKSYYDQHIEDYQKDETRTLQYVSRQVKATASDTARAINLINDIKTEIAAGATFESMAEIHSEGPSASNAGYLGWFGKGKMAPPFEVAAFAAPVGRVVGPILTQFGYHLIKVEAKRTTGNAPEVEARHILIEIRPSETTRDQIRRELKNLEFLADEIGFKKATDSLGMEPGSSNKLRQKDTFVSGLGSFQSAVRFAYLSELGAHSPVMQNDENFALFSLSEIDPAGSLPLDQAKASINRKLMNDGKLALAKEAAEKLSNEVKMNNDWAAIRLEGREGLDFEQISSAHANEAIRGLGQYPEIFGYLENAEIGSVSPVISTSRGSVFVRLNAKSDFDEADFNNQYETLYKTLTQNRQNDVWVQYVKSLREKADIVDNRLRQL
ncbi:MAG: SurA N-terminal domain-containing protein [Candidatus Marinimicrobia bacterium]|nr:SurA N-terminal domain-containing protein [Candidatus Neomarinimicrobiota bacterium]